MTRSFRFNLFSVLHLLLCGSIHLCAQNSNYLEASIDPQPLKVLEIGSKEVEYPSSLNIANRIPGQLGIDVTEYTIKNDSVFGPKINSMKDTQYLDLHHNAIKVNLLSPLFSHLALSFEHCIKPGRSVELGLGVIGLGLLYEEVRLKGLFGRIGFKWITHPDYYRRGMRYAHVLKGGYVKPEIIIGSYTAEYYTYSYPNSSFSTSSGIQSPIRKDTYSKNITLGGVLVNFGKQWVIDDRFVCDAFIGFGYGFSYTHSSLETSEDELYHYAFWGGFQDFPIALSGGIKLGFVFGK